MERIEMQELPIEDITQLLKWYCPVLRLWARKSMCETLQKRSLEFFPTIPQPCITCDRNPPEWILTKPETIVGYIEPVSLTDYKLEIVCVAIGKGDPARLRNIRERLDMTVEEMEEAIGIPHTALDMAERGIVKSATLSKALGLPDGWIPQVVNGKIVIYERNHDIHKVFKRGEISL